MYIKKELLDHVVAFAFLQLGMLLVFVKKELHFSLVKS